MSGNAPAVPELVSRDVGGVRMAHRELGAGDPLVLLHGYPTSSYLWRGVMPHLAATHRVLAPDLPGFGGSDLPADAVCTFTYHADAFGRWLDATGLAKVDLVLHDFGGPVGLTWAMANRNRVGRIVVVNSFLSPRYRWNDHVVLLAMATPGLRRAFTSAPLARRVLRMGVRDKRAMPRALADAYLEPFGDVASRPRLVKLFRDALAQPGHPELHAIWNGLPRLDHPIGLVISGEDIFCKTYMEQLAVHLQSAPVMRLPRTGHLVQEEQPERLAAAIVELLQRLQPNAVSG